MVSFTTGRASPHSRLPRLNSGERIYANYQSYAGKGAAEAIFGSNYSRLVALKEQIRPDQFFSAKRERIRIGLNWKDPAKAQRFMLWADESRRLLRASVNPSGLAKREGRGVRLYPANLTVHVMIDTQHGLKGSLRKAIEGYVHHLVGQLISVNGTPKPYAPSEHSRH